MNVVQLMKDMIGKKPAEVSVKELQVKIAEVNRIAATYKRKACLAEKEALQLRERAFQGGEDAHHKALVMRRAKNQYDEAQKIATQAATFIDQVASLSEVLLVKEIAAEFQSVGLLTGSVEVEDWQRALDEFSLEIKDSVKCIQGLSDEIAAILPRGEEDPELEADVDEIETLFRQMQEATARNDPAEAQRLQELIDKRVGMAF